MPMTARPSSDEPPGDVEADEPGGAGDQDRLSRHRSLSPRALPEFCQVGRLPPAGPAAMWRAGTGLRGSPCERQACCARRVDAIPAQGLPVAGGANREGHGSGQAAIAHGRPHAATAARSLRRHRGLVLPVAPPADGARRPRRRLRGPRRHQCRRGWRRHPRRRLHPASPCASRGASCRRSEASAPSSPCEKSAARGPGPRAPRRAAGERARRRGRFAVRAAPTSTPSPASAMPSSRRAARHDCCAASFRGCCVRDQPPPRHRPGAKSRRPATCLSRSA